jgi:hypothetical protein
MFKMFKIALSSVLSGAHDLGFGSYKDKAQARMARISNGIKEMRSNHTMKDTSGSRGSDGYISGGGAIIAGGAGAKAVTANRSRRNNASLSSGGGSRAVQGNNAAKQSGKSLAMDDHASIDGAIQRGGGGTPAEPAKDTVDYLTK